MGGLTVHRFTNGRDRPQTMHGGWDALGLKPGRKDTNSYQKDTAWPKMNLSVLMGFWLGAGTKSCEISVSSFKF
jgi:hypothetical protein